MSTGIGKKALVTGAAGFIGSHLVDRLLHEGCEVRGIDNLSTGNRRNLKDAMARSDFAERFQFAEADVADFPELPDWMHDVDYVFHLAALADIVPSVRQPQDYHHSNVETTVRLLEAARNADRLPKFVYAASSSCYGLADQLPTTEEATIAPQYPYALTKRVGEEYVLHWSQLYGLPAVSLRFFNVYGPRARTAGTYGAVFGVFLAQKLAGQPMTIVGDGTQSRDFVYVTDVVDALYKAALSDHSGRVYNVGSSSPQTINRLCELLGGSTTNIPKRPGEPDCTWADTTLIRKDLGWAPSVSFEQGVRNMLKSIDAWKTAPVWTPTKIADATTDWFRYLGEPGSSDSNEIESTDLSSQPIV
ncbi:MAG: SDR family oxidoreductase [Phycisphaerae bacterium]